MYERRIRPQPVAPNPQPVPHQQSGVTLPLPQQMQAALQQAQQQGLLDGVSPSQMNSLKGLFSQNQPNIAWNGPRQGGILPETSGDFMPAADQLSGLLGGGGGGMLPEMGGDFMPMSEQLASVGGQGGSGGMFGGGSGMMGNAGPVAAIMAAVAATKEMERAQGNSTMGKVWGSFNAPSINQIKADPKLGWTTALGIPFVNGFIRNKKAAEAEPEWQGLLGGIFG